MAGVSGEGPAAVAMTRRHLVTVWNPAYAADAMEVHQRILRGAAEACREKKWEEDFVPVLPHSVWRRSATIASSTVRDQKFLMAIPIPE